MMSTTYSRWTQSDLESFAVAGPSATRDLLVRMGQHQRAIADIHRLHPKLRDAATGLTDAKIRAIRGHPLYSHPDFARAGERTSDATAEIPWNSQ